MCGAPDGGCILHEVPNPTERFGRFGRCFAVRKTPAKTL